MCVQKKPFLLVLFIFCTLINLFSEPKSHKPNHHSLRIQPMFHSLRWKDDTASWFIFDSLAGGIDLEYHFKDRRFHQALFIQAAGGSGFAHNSEIRDKTFETYHILLRMDYTSHFLLGEIIKNLSFFLGYSLLIEGYIMPVQKVTATGQPWIEFTGIAPSAALEYDFLKRNTLSLRISMPIFGYLYRPDWSGTSPGLILSSINTYFDIFAQTFHDQGRIASLHNYWAPQWDLCWTFSLHHHFKLISFWRAGFIYTTEPKSPDLKYSRAFSAFSSCLGAGVNFEF